MPSVVCHVLLVETDNGLVLVDSGFGPRDCADPALRVGPARHVIRPVFDAELYRRRESHLLMVCAHDPTLFEHAKVTA